MRKLLILACVLWWFLPAHAWQGAHWQIEVDDYDESYVTLAYQYGRNVYAYDTILLSAGKGTLALDSMLPAGTWYLVFPPDNKWVELLVGYDGQRYTIHTAAPDFAERREIKGSPENDLFQMYREYVQERLDSAAAIQARMEKVYDEATLRRMQDSVDALGREVRHYQEAVSRANPHLFVSRLIRALIEIEPPEDADSTAALWYLRRHYWDTFDFGEPGLVRTVIVADKVDTWLDALHPPEPDTIIAAVDSLLAKAEQNEEMYRFLLTYLLNKYYKPPFMGLDAVFVHLADHYYAAGKAPWVDEQSLQRILTDAEMMRGVLIGRPAPEVEVQWFDRAQQAFTDSLVRLYDLEAPFVVVLIWKPGCPACRKTEDELKKYYPEWKALGGEIFSITSATYKDLDKAVKDAVEKDMPWIVTADPYFKARALQKYYAVTVPRLYLLDADKKIIASRVNPERLDQIIRAYMARHTRPVQDE